MLKRFILIFLVLFLSQNSWAADGYSILNQLNSNIMDEAEQKNLNDALTSYISKEADKTFLQDMLLKFAPVTKTHHRTAMYRLSNLMAMAPFKIFVTRLLLDKNISNDAKASFISHADISSDYMYQVFLNIKKETGKYGIPEYLSASLINRMDAIHDSSKLLSLVFKDIHPDITREAIWQLNDYKMLEEIVKSNLAYKVKSLAVDKLNNFAGVLDNVFHEIDDVKIKSKIVHLSDNPDIVLSFYKDHVANTEGADTESIKKIVDKDILLEIIQKDTVLQNRMAAAINHYDIFYDREIVSLIPDKKTLRAFLKYHKRDKKLQAAARKGFSLNYIVFLILNIVLAVFFFLLSAKLPYTNKCPGCSCKIPKEQSCCLVCGRIFYKNFINANVIFVLGVFCLANLLIPLFLWLKDDPNLLFRIFAWAAIAVTGFIYIICTFITLGIPIELKKDFKKLQANPDYSKHSDRGKRSRVKSKKAEKTEAEKKKQEPRQKKIPEAPQTKVWTDTDLILAAASGNFSKLKQIVASGIDVNNARNEHNATPLFMAAHEKYTEIVKYLLEKGADPNIKIKLGATPLFVAVQKQPDVEIIESLLKAGADPNIQDHEGSTPLIIAASENGNKKTAQLLIDHNARVDLANDKNITALYFAAQNGYTQFVKILIDAGADTDIAMEQGATPLFIAAQLGHNKIAEMLIRAGADQTIALDNGMTPKKIAVENGHDDIAAMLLDEPETEEAGEDQNLFDDPNTFDEDDEPEKEVDHPNLRADVDWEAVRKTSIEDLAKKCGHSAIENAVEYTGTIAELFDKLGEPHFQKIDTQPYKYYTLGWFASDGWISLIGTGRGYNDYSHKNLNDLHPTALTLRLGEISDKSEQGYYLYERQEDPWGRLGWFDCEHTDDINYDIWKRKIKMENDVGTDGDEDWARML